MDPSSREGLVLRIDAKVCHVEVDGDRHVLPLAGKLFEERGRQKQPLAVGDRVRVRLGSGGAGEPAARGAKAEDGAIDEVLPRTSSLVRRSASEREVQAQVLAANVTLVLAVAAAAEPPFQPELVDGVLAAAARDRIPCGLVLTKADRDAGAAAGWAALYRGLGYRVLATSTAPGHETHGALQELAALLHGNRSVLCGLSGAGKTTLLNAIEPALHLRTGALNHIAQGRHTTTRTELLPLPGGGHVLDTPGVRSFHLFEVGSQELQFLFPEIAAILPQCAFRSCLHREGDADCAVRAAVAAGRVPPSRYASYCTMLARALAAEDPDPTSRSRTGAGRGKGGRRRRG